MATCKSDRCYNHGGKLWGGYCFDCYESKCKSCGTTYQKDRDSYSGVRWPSYRKEGMLEYCPKCARNTAHCGGLYSGGYCAKYDRKHWHCTGWNCEGVIYSRGIHICNDCDDEADD